MRPRLIILEGCDCSGKTTLAKKLCGELGYDYMHFEAPETGDDQVHMYQSLLLDCLKDQSRRLVLDRSWLSDPIYAPIMGRPIEVCAHDSEYLAGLVKSLGGHYVFCDPGVERVIAKWSSRIEDELIKDMEDIKEIYYLYRRIARLHKSSVPESVHTYSYYRDDSLTMLLEALQ